MIKMIMMKIISPFYNLFKLGLNEIYKLVLIFPYFMDFLFKKHFFTSKPMKNMQVWIFIKLFDFLIIVIFALLNCFFLYELSEICSHTRSKVSQFLKELFTIWKLRLKILMLQEKSKNCWFFRATANLLKLFF